MFKDYYKILGVTQTTKPQEIKAAYRTMSKKWHPDLNTGLDVTAVMQNINEAYAILKDPDKRSRYDKEYSKFKQQSYQPHNIEDDTKSHSYWYYDYDVCDESVREDITNARNYAQKIVSEFMDSFRQATQNAAKGAWDGAKDYVWAAIILTLLGLLIRVYTSANSNNFKEISVSNKTPSITIIE